MSYHNILKMTHVKQMKNAVLITVDPTKKIEDPDFESYLKLFTNLVKTATHPFCLIYDFTNCGMLSLSQITTHRKLVQNLEQYIRKNLICTAFIVNNAAVRFGLNTHFYLAGTIRPSETVANLEDAISFAKSIK